MADDEILAARFSEVVVAGLDRLLGAERKPRARPQAAPGELDVDQYGRFDGRARRARMAAR